MKARPGILILLVIAQAFITSAPQPWSALALQSVATSDPLGHFEGVGVPGSLSWTGDGQRLSNPSFETGSLAPWLQSQSNTASGSNIALTSPGYQDTTSALLSVYSGNSSALSLASDSTLSLTNDLTQQKVGFTSGTRFRIAVQVQAVTGTTGNDTVEARLVLTNSTGGIKTLHYVFAERGSLPVNTASDGYLKAPGFGSTNQWVNLDRSLPADTSAVFSDSASINSVQSVSLTVHAQTLPGPPMVDPHMKYWELGFGHWVAGEPVVYDSNNNGVYDLGETVVGCAQPSCPTISPGTTLASDPRIRFLDSNYNTVWDCSTMNNQICTSGETAVYEDELIHPMGAATPPDGIYDALEPIILGTAPLPGTLLMYVIQSRTRALFDQAELYTATGGYDWVRNGGFEAGLTGWYSNSSFTSVTSPVNSGTRSARASVIGESAELAQSIDARPQVNSTTTFKASVNVASITGTSISDSVNIWLGLDDSQGNSLSLYYYFGTGTGTVPANRTDTVYLKANGFGTIGQWLNINDSLLQRVQAAVQSNALSYIPPYTVELLVVEASASPSQATSAFFDQISLGTTPRTAPASSYFYALDGQNTTYVYTASVPQGSFSVDMPLGRALVNVTSPEGKALPAGDYTVSTSSGSTRVIIPDSASFKHLPMGDWKLFTSSTNTITTLYVENTSTLAPGPTRTVRVGTTVNFVSQSKDPFNQILQNIQINLTLWDSFTGLKIGTPWAGFTSSQGWWNVSGITLPLPGTLPGVYKLQAVNLYALYPGIKTFQIAVQYTVTLDVDLSASQAAAGDIITISGTVARTDVSGPAPDVNVTISYRLAGNSQWTILAIVKSDSSGKYTYTWTPPEGEYQVMASTGDTTTAPAQATPAHLIVNPAGPPWLIIIGAVAGAAAATVIVFMLQRRRKNTDSKLGQRPLGSSG